MVEDEEEQVTYSSPLIESTLKAAEENHHYLTLSDVQKRIKQYENEMKKAAKEMRFEDAAQARDKMRQFQQMELTLG